MRKALHFRSVKKPQDIGTDRSMHTDSYRFQMAPPSPATEPIAEHAGLQGRLGSGMFDTSRRQ